MEAELAAQLVEHVGTGQVGGHQVRRELDPPEVQVEGERQRADRERLGNSGDTFEERVPTGEEAYQHLAKHFFLAEDDSAKLVEDVSGAFGRAGCKGLVHGCVVWVIRRSASLASSVSSPSAPRAHSVRKARAASPRGKPGGKPFQELGFCALLGRQVPEPPGKAGEDQATSGATRARLPVRTGKCLYVLQR